MQAIRSYIPLGGLFPCAARSSYCHACRKFSLAARRGALPRAGGRNFSTEDRPGEFKYGGRDVKVETTKGPSYEPNLITSAEDRRIQHLMKVIGCYQAMTSSSSQVLSVDNWGGRWTLGCRNVGWTAFLAFLGVPAQMFEAASTYDDHHWYKVSKEGLTMRHEIPAQNTKLHYTATLDGQWRSSPYNKQTSTEWSAEESTKHHFHWRNQWLCYPTALRTEWENKGGSGHGQPTNQNGVHSITVMERHLVAENMINFHVWVYPLGGDPEDSSKFLVPRTGVSYIRVGDELPAYIDSEH